MACYSELSLLHADMCPYDKKAEGIIRDGLGDDSDLEDCLANAGTFFFDHKGCRRALANCISNESEAR